MKKIIISIIIALLAIGAWMFKYFHGEDYILYNEAKELEANGDIYAAHEKISEALKINPKNRKVISYKSELYFLITNDSNLKNAHKLKSDAEMAMEKGDYALAAKYLDSAWAAIDNVSSLYSRYDEAVTLQKDIIIDVERVVHEAPEKYYLKAYDLYQRGEYERAYNMLGYISSPSPKVTKLKDDIAYKIGMDKYDLIKSNPNAVTIINEALIWLEKVSTSSPNYIDAKALISKLKKSNTK